MPNLDAIKTTRAMQPNFIPAPKPKKRRKWPWLIALVLFLGLIFGGGYYVLAQTNKIFSKKQSLLSRIGSLIVSPNKPLIGQDSGTVNILLMGIGGDGHDGPYLTDTMIVASIDVKTDDVTLISIPRDFEYVIPGEGMNKINAVYAYAYQTNPDTAGEAAITAAEQLTGLQIPYYAVVDFTGFVKAIDDIGGVDVVVQNTFTDDEFPNDYPYDTKGYLAPVTFTAGPAHMDGRTALIFARSRHSDNPLEGSDFARSERQKKIIAAVRDKVVALKLTDLTTINNLLSDFTNNVRTNLEPYELEDLAQLAKKIDSNNFYSFSLDPDGTLICSALVDPVTGKPAPPPVAPVTTTTSSTSTSTDSSTSDTAPPAAPVDNRMYAVLPCAGKTFDDIEQFVTNAPLLAKVKAEGATIEVQNSTGKSYVTDQWSALSNLGINVKFTTYHGAQPYDQTIMYDNSNNTKPNTLTYLKSHFTMMQSDVGYPSSTADFVVVIGNDAL